jgi:hypothetical protein
MLAFPSRSPKDLAENILALSATPETEFLKNASKVKTPICLLCYGQDGISRLICGRPF